MFMMLKIFMKETERTAGQQQQSQPSNFPGLITVLKKSDTVYCILHIDAVTFLTFHKNFAYTYIGPHV